MKRRGGFSLLEVLVATATLLGSVIVLGHLAFIGQQHASAADDFATAQRLCQNVLNEILAGVTPPDAVENEPFTDEPGWLYSIELTPVGVCDMLQLKVTVSQEPAENRPTRQFSLVRWMRPAEGFVPEEYEEDQSMTEQPEEKP